MRVSRVACGRSGSASVGAGSGSALYATKRPRPWPISAAEKDEPFRPKTYNVNVPYSGFRATVASPPKSHNDLDRAAAHNAVDEGVGVGHKTASRLPRPRVHTKLSRQRSEEARF